MSERSRFGIPTDKESYRVSPKALAELLGNTAGNAVGAIKGAADSIVDRGKDTTKETFERSKEASFSVMGIGSTALTSITEVLQMMNNEARSRLSGLPGLGDRHPEDE